jgi:hypothetical protein
MDPNTMQYLARARLDELRREADLYRLSRAVPRPSPLTRRLRVAAGRRMIGLGERLVSPRVGRSTAIGHQPL